MALATTLATSSSRWVPWEMVFFRALYVSLGSLARMTASLNTMLPNTLGTSFIWITPILG